MNRRESIIALITRFRARLRPRAAVRPAGS